MPQLSPLTSDSIKQPFWALPLSDVFSALSSGPTGLDETSVEQRIAVFGTNTIRSVRRLPRVKIVLNQLKSPLIVILAVAGIVTLFLREWVESFVIFAAVLLNTGLGFWQENKAETVLEHLKSYLKSVARVRRDNEEHEIDASRLVPGDIVRLTQGDRIPADVRLIAVNSFEVDESIVTGESLPIEKTVQPLPTNTPLSDRRSMAFSGTLVVQGFADAIVTCTGRHTEFGRIAELVSTNEREATPLQRAVSRFATQSSIVLCILTVIVFFVGIFSGQRLIDMFVISVAIAVSAVPEGLPIALTVILAIGVERLAKRQGIVRKLLAAETLGSTTLILTDKTGTLTQAKMELASVITRNERDSEEATRTLSDAILNTDVVIENPDDSPSDWAMTGRAIEIALVRGAALRGILLQDRRNATQILHRFPFDSKHKYSLTHIQELHETKYVAIGAPEILLASCDASSEDRRFWEQEIDRRARAGERVLGVITKTALSTERIHLDSPLEHFTFRGLLSFRDPLRPTVKDAIQRIADTGVRTVIVTGDHRGTAEAIARQLGIINGKHAVLTGEELGFLTDDDLLGRIPSVAVFARVTPEQKLQITNLYKRLGEVVAVTGDGVNDAPALHAADIGIAVGAGTDVAKSASDLIILDNNFETIVAAIEEGRRVLSNIKKVIVYLLTNAFNELILIGGSLLLGLPLPLTALQILYINFFSDSFPAVAFAFETRVDYQQRFRRYTRLLIDPEMRSLIFGAGILTSMVIFGIYTTLITMGMDAQIVQTFIFATFASYTLFAAFSLRSLQTSIASYNPFDNRMLTIGVGIGLVLTLLAVYLPLFNRIFHTTPLPFIWLLGVIGVGVFNVAFLEAVKWVFQRRSRA